MIIISRIGDLRDSSPDGCCQVWHRAEIFREERCSALPDIALTAGCVHEHVRTFEVCGGCMAVIAETSPAMLRCGRCYFGDDSHECTIEIINEEWLEKS